MAVYFLDKAPAHELNDIKLMKLMVLAERRSMMESTCMITGDNFYSMQHGPVLSNTLNAMNGSVVSDLWNRHIMYAHYDNVDSNRSKLKTRIDFTEILSGYEIELLDAIWAEYGNMDKWGLRELTHTFLEWDRECEELNTSRPIKYATIFEKGFNMEHKLAIAKAEEIEF